jgi:hypothetical protein
MHGVYYKNIIPQVFLSSVKYLPGGKQVIAKHKSPNYDQHRGPEFRNAVSV